MNRSPDLPASVPSFEDLFTTERVRLGRALFLLTGDTSEADDLAQEAMVLVFERWDRVSRADSPVAYLYATAMNLHRSRLRRLRVHRSRAHETASPAASEAEVGVIDDRDELARLLAELPVGQRQALVLCEWLSLSSEEAGQILGIEAVSIRVRVSRAKAALRGSAAHQEQARGGDRT